MLYVHLMALAVKPAGLGGLKKAMFVLRCLDRGETRKQIVQALNGDEELVDVWISFLMQYDWIEQQNESGEWSVTSKGREWHEEISKTLIEN
jgi:predicted transcriptional regulator